MMPPSSGLSARFSTNSGLHQRCAASGARLWNWKREHALVVAITRCDDHWNSQRPWYERKNVKNNIQDSKIPHQDVEKVKETSVKMKALCCISLCPKPNTFDTIGHLRMQAGSEALRR